MNRLSLATLQATKLRPALPRPGLGAGVVHLGLGAFARAHTAVFTEAAMLATEDHRWGLVGITQRSSRMVRQLRPQDGLFTVTERGAESRGPRLVSSVLDVLDGSSTSEEVLQRVASEETLVLTLTVTEKAYQSSSVPIRLLCQGLARRHRTHRRPLTVVSCDNLPVNGALTRDLVLRRLQHERSDDVADWVQHQVAFPGTMVDRMVPATSADDTARASTWLGLRDESAVVAEPFRQWVVEDSFAADRPAWERAGAILVDDALPWQRVKLRLLNAAHLLLAYLGLAAGLQTIAEVATDPVFSRAAESLVFEDAVPVLGVPAGLDVADYGHAVLRRFANPALGHTTAKVGGDGSQKLGPRIGDTARHQLRRGRTPRWVALTLALWMWHVLHPPAGGPDDPLAPALRDRVRSVRPDGVIEALLGSSSVLDPELAGSSALAAAVGGWYATLHTHGIDGLRSEIMS